MKRPLSKRLVLHRETLRTLLSPLPDTAAGVICTDHATTCRYKTCGC
jgi:hypothetical protein